MSVTKTYIFHRSAIALMFKALKILFPISFAYWTLIYFANTGGIADTTLIELTTSGYRIFCLAIVLNLIRLYFNDLYVLAERNIVHSGGRISLYANKTSISYDDVRDADIDQGILGRIFNYGTVTFGTASAEGHEVEFVDIPYPEEIAKHVRDYIKERQKKGTTTFSDFENGATNNE